MIPRRANAVVILMPAAAKRTSQTSAWIRPMPAQAPFSAAMIGLAMVVGYVAGRRSADAGLLLPAAIFSRS